MGILLSSKIGAHMENSEIDSKNIFHLAINIVGNIDNFYLIYSVLKSQCIDASCHHALYCVIIMNPMINMYFVSKGGKNFKITWTRGCHVFGFMLLYGSC
jgi:hypothetical protein